MESTNRGLCLDSARIESLITSQGGSWAHLQAVRQVDSTNSALAAMPHAGTGTCIVAEQQTAGRGRLDRVWDSPPGSGVWMSVLVRPDLTRRAMWGWLPLLAAFTARQVLTDVCGVPAWVKWPNDLVIDGPGRNGDPGPRKIGGILTEVTAQNAVIFGLGINMSTTIDQLPTDQATSVAVEGGKADREVVIAEILLGLERALAHFDAGTWPVEQYTDHCLTIGRNVRVMLPGGQCLQGSARGISRTGQLLVAHDAQITEVAAGDVIHATI